MDGCHHDMVKFQGHVARLGRIFPIIEIDHLSFILLILGMVIPKHNRHWDSSVLSSHALNEMAIGKRKKAHFKI